MSEIKGCMNCGNISCGNNKKRESAGCGRWISPEDKKKIIKDEMKNRISMALKDPILQQGFEIICKENAELKEINEGYCRSRDRLISIGFPNFKDCKEYAEHLTKAKEIIKKFSEFVNNGIEYDPEHPQEHTDLWNKLCEEAEQFLKESEK